MLSQRVLERYPGLAPPPFEIPYYEPETCSCSSRYAGLMGRQGLSFIRPAQPRPVDKAPSVLDDDPELSYVMGRIDTLVAEIPSPRHAHIDWNNVGIWVGAVGLVAVLAICVFGSIW